MNKHYGYFPTQFEIDDTDEDSLYPRMIHTYYMGGRSNGKSQLLNMYKDLLGYKQSKEYYFKIKKVIFNDPATIVFWADGSKTVVKCQEGDVFDKEKGLAMAISKRALGDKGRYCEEFKKWIPEILEIKADAAAAEIKEIKETKVETELFFDDTLQITLCKAGKTFNEAAKKIISAVHESNRIINCQYCINVDQNTEVKKETLR